MNENDLIQYDEDDSVKFIQNYLPQSMKEKFSSDDILYILDLIDEFYESKGDVELTDEEYEEFDREMIEYIVKTAKEDCVGNYTSEEVECVLDAEVEYCESIKLI